VVVVVVVIVVVVVVFVDASVGMLLLRAAVDCSTAARAAA